MQPNPVELVSDNQSMNLISKLVALPS